jgi:hypothetical protein
MKRTQRRWLWVLACALAIAVAIPVGYSIVASNFSAKIVQPNLEKPAVFVPNRIWFCNTLRSVGGLQHFVTQVQADPSTDNLVTLKIAAVNAPLSVERLMVTIYTDVRQHTHKAAVQTAVNQVKEMVPC